MVHKRLQWWSGLMMLGACLAPRIFAVVYDNDPLVILPLKPISQMAPMTPQMDVVNERNFHQKLTYANGTTTVSFTHSKGGDAACVGVTMYYRKNKSDNLDSVNLGGARFDWHSDLTGVSAGDQLDYFFIQHLQGKAYPIRVNTAWFTQVIGQPEPAPPKWPLTSSIGGRFRDRHEFEYRFDHWVGEYIDGTTFNINVEDWGDSLRMHVVTNRVSLYATMRYYDGAGVPVDSSKPICTRGDFNAGIGMGPVQPSHDWYYTVKPVTPGQLLDFEWTFNVANIVLPLDNGTGGHPWQQYYTELYRYYVGRGFQPMEQNPRATAAGRMSTSVVSARKWAFNQHLIGLSFQHLNDFLHGKSLFDTDFKTGLLSNPGPEFDCAGDAAHPIGQAAPRQSPHYKAGVLGPTYNNVSCTSCHFLDGRGRPPEKPGDSLLTMLIRLSVPGTDEHGGPKPHDVYGGQLEDKSVGSALPEGKTTINYTEVPSGIDGVTLRKPTYTFSNLTSDPIDGKAVLFSPRVAPHLSGMGLLSAVPDADIQAIAAAQSGASGGKIHGKVNMVWDADMKQMRVGRFGWKAGQPTLRQQAAAAFLGDMGVTSALFPNENCAPGQAGCPQGATTEISSEQLDNIETYLKGLAPPPRANWKDPNAIAGKALFEKAGCQICHVPSLVTGTDAKIPEMSGVTFQPFTDLLLHDMGAGLADDRPEYQASGYEWRTPPLWGLQYFQDVNGHTLYLHDGRARNLLEAILWHDGEAKDAKDKVVAMSDNERTQLLAYVKYPFADAYGATDIATGINPNHGPYAAVPVLKNFAFVVGGQAYNLLAAGVTGLRILNLSGREILAKDVQGDRFAWDRRDNAGRVAPMGLYFLQLMGKGGIAKAQHKFMVR